MKALLINNHSLHIEHADEIQKLLATLGYVDVTIVPREELKSEEADLYDLVFLSGTSGVGAFPVMGNDDRLTAEFVVVRKRMKPLLAVCYGCQILARAYGAELKPLPEPIEQKIITVRLTENGMRLLGDSDTHEYLVYSSHKNYIATVPEDFTVIAVSEYGPEIIVHKTRPLVGVLFHPEHVMAENRGSELVQKVFNTVMKSFE